jgi:hypothetical protein
MKSAWKSESVFYYISTFLSFTHIVPWMDSLDLISYLVIFYLCAFVIACSIIAFLYVSYSSSRLKTSFIWPTNMLRQGCYVIQTVLFIPFLGKSRLLYLFHWKVIINVLLTPSYRAVYLHARLCAAR